MPGHRFGDYLVDADAVEVRGPDGVREVEPQVFDVLHYLVTQQGRLVTKEELLDNVWGDRFVSESALTTRIKQARRAIDDDGRTQWAIKTVHGRGYRFLPEVTAAPDPSERSSGAAPSAPPAPPAPLPDELRADNRQLFCGREEELAQCLEIVERVDAAAPFGWVWLLGEPGIGKSRLAAEVARTAQASGHRVLFGHNSEDLRVPYQPFIEMIRQAGDAETSSTQVAGVASLPSALRPLLPSPRPAPSGDAPPALDGEGSTIDRETQRYEMFEAVSDWLVQQAATRPVLAVLDDVHWAADSTIQLLAHLQRHRGGGAVTLLLTSRDTAPDINPRISDLLATGQGSATTATIRLEGLSSDEAAALVGDGVDLHDVMRQTAGNPLFLQAVNRDDGSVDMRSAVRRRLASLDDSVQDTLRLASVLGYEFELKVAAAATGRSELDLLDDLELAVAARLLDDVGRDRFRFVHALVRSSLRAELSSARQARLHQQIAVAIHEVFADDPQYLPQLAHHTSEAAAVAPELVPLAIERLRRAAQASIAKFSFEEAAELLERARGLAPPGDPALHAELALEQGTAEARAGRNLPASRTFEEAMAAAAASGIPVLRIEAALGYEDAWWRPGLSGGTALACVRDAIEVLDAAVADGAPVPAEAELRARLAVAELRAMTMSGQRDPVDEVFERARRYAAAVASPAYEASALNVYLSHTMFQGISDTTRGMVDRLAELEPRIDDGDVALHAIHLRLLHGALAGEFGRQQDLVATMAQVQERSHSRFWGFIRSNQEAMEAFYRGDLEASERLAAHCLALADDLPDEDGSGIYGLRMFLIRREQDRLASLAPLVRHVLSQADSDAVWTPGLALLLAETGAPAEAAAALAAARAAEFELPPDAMWSTVMVLMIETMLELGDVEACRMLRRRFSRLAGSNVLTGSGLLCFGRAERYLGMLALADGELDAAEEYLGVALEADAAGGSVLWSNESRLWLSRARRAQGHHAEADAMAAVVADQAAAAGLPRLYRLAASAAAS